MFSLQETLTYSFHTLDRRQRIHIKDFLNAFSNFTFTKAIWRTHKFLSVECGYGSECTVSVEL